VTLEQVIVYLESVAERPDAANSDQVAETLADLKARAVAEGDEQQAKRLWCLQTTLRIHTLYVQSFWQIKEGEFYRAWCDLEKIEIALASVERHLDTPLEDFSLASIKRWSEQWQSLFPYKVFLSPEMIFRAECSICGLPIRPRHPCGHIVGEIYKGEPCYRVIKAIDQVLGIAFVTNPVQKYSVVFMHDPVSGKSRDHYRYDAVKYAANALCDPFHDWEVELTTKRQPHSRFAGVGGNDKCPCDSGKVYKSCCLPETGVLRPHLQFSFFVQPPPGTLAEQYIP
jgi:hypothetical protein